MTAHPTFRLWLEATRPRTLPVGAASVLTGVALAIHLDGFHALSAILAVITALLLQIAANFANDALDFRRGADTLERVGPTRLAASGQASAGTILVATGVVLGLAVICGLYLVMRGGWIILALGLASLVCAVAYTGGPFPIAYKGLGEVFVFLFFGPTAVAGTAYVQTRHWEWQMLAIAIPVGLISSATLVVNNLRDIETDRRAGKNTLAVRFGARKTILQYRLLWLVGTIAPPIFWLAGWLSWTWVVTLVAVPGIVKLWRLVGSKRGRELNMVLGATARHQLVYCLALSAALILST
ncbi:MAG: 1,4-dihydroxy-2-naphthoate polyprenyltransferase [Thermomicrobiales bacterium]